MPARKNYLLKALSILGTLNLLWVIWLICTTTPVYIVVDGNWLISQLVLIYFPFVFATTALFLFLLDLLRHKEKNWFAFLPAFLAILPVAVFAMDVLWHLE